MTACPDSAPRPARGAVGSVPPSEHLLAGAGGRDDVRLGQLGTAAAAGSVRGQQLPVAAVVDRLGGGLQERDLPAVVPQVLHGEHEFVDGDGKIDERAEPPDVAVQRRAIAQTMKEQGRSVQSASMDRYAESFARPGCRAGEGHQAVDRYEFGGRALVQCLDAEGQKSGADREFAVAGSECLRAVARDEIQSVAGPQRDQVGWQGDAGPSARGDLRWVGRGFRRRRFAHRRGAAPRLAFPSTRSAAATKR